MTLSSVAFCDGGFCFLVGGVHCFSALFFYPIDILPFLLQMVKLIDELWSVPFWNVIPAAKPPPRNGVLVVWGVSRFATSLAVRFDYRRACSRSFTFSVLTIVEPAPARHSSNKFDLCSRLIAAFTFPFAVAQLTQFQLFFFAFDYRRAFPFPCSSVSSVSVIFFRNTIRATIGAFREHVSMKGSMWVWMDDIFTNKLVI